MNRALRLRIAAGVAAVLLASVAAALLVGSDLILDALSRGAERAARRVGSRLQAAGVLAYWDFDAVWPLELVGRTPSVNGGTRLVPGRDGSARSFLPREHGVFRTAIPLDALGKSFTLSCWLRLPQPPPDQHIFQYLAVGEGRLLMRLPGQEEISAPIPVFGRFFPVAITVDVDGGRARLYVGGAAAGEVPLRTLRHPPEPLSFGQERNAPPPSFALDEVSLWRRALTGEEIRGLARLRWSLAVDTSFLRFLNLRLAEAALGTYRAFLLAADLFNPFLHESRLLGARLPSYALSLSRGDVQEFDRYFNVQQANGLTAPGTSKRRRVELLEGPQRRTALMELVTDAQAGPEGSPKRAFSLEILSEDEETERRLLVRPIEGRPYLLEVLAGRLARASGLRAAAAELCTASFNGTLEGACLCFEHPTEQGSVWLGAPGAWQAIVRRAPFFRDEVLAEFDRLAAPLAGALASDRKSPLSSREILRDVRAQRRLLEQELSDRTARSDEALVARVAEHAREDLFLGDNPHATLIVGDLDLAVRMINGAALSFESLTPAVLGNDGRVAQPEREAAPSTLRVTVRSGAATRVRDLSFLVLPRRRPLPILSVLSAEEPPRGRTATALAEFVDGEGRLHPLLPGRIRLRGNTSLFRLQNLKKYYRLELDHPYDVPGIGRTRLLFLTSEWRDVALMRDRLSFDLFRAFSEPGKPRYAPHVQPVELVVNGDYKGVYDLTDRVDGDLLEFGKPTAGAGRAVLYKARGGRANFQNPVRGAYVQKVPDWREGEHWGPFDALITFIGSTTPEEFRQGVEQVVDIDSVIDFEVLLAFTSNYEGANYNLYLARKPGPSARFFIVPWDYDMTFHRGGIPSNFLIGRLHRDLPGYSRRVLERWRHLRAGLLSERSLTARIDGYEVELKDAAERNYRRWPNTPGETWEGKVGELRAFIAEHLRRLDAHFLAVAGG